jgi:hypothetical protein
MKKFQSRRFCAEIRQRLPGILTNQSHLVRPIDDLTALTPSKVEIGLPIKEDLKAGAFSSNIHTQWSNVPLPTRSLLENASSTSSFYSPELEPSSAGLISKAKALLSIVGKGPVDLAIQRGEYCNQYELQPYKKGMKAAYHWSKNLVPRSVAARCPGDMRIDPVDSDRSVLLIDQVMDRTTVLLGFSGYGLSGIKTGVKAWKRALQTCLTDSDHYQVLNVHFSEGWLSRRTHPLTRQILRTFGSSDESTTDQRKDKLYIYRGSWKRDVVLDFHLYNSSLPCLLLIDKRGYIRWHAVGLPTDETVDLVGKLLPRLRNEK